MTQRAAFVPSSRGNGATVGELVMGLRLIADAAHALAAGVFELGPFVRAAYARGYQDGCGTPLDETTISEARSRARALELLLP